MSAIPPTAAFTSRSIPLPLITAFFFWYQGSGNNGEPYAVFQQGIDRLFLGNVDGGDFRALIKGVESLDLGFDEWL